MKILHVTKKYPPLIGGDSFVVFNLKFRQEKAGHAVYVLTSNCRELRGMGIFTFGLQIPSETLDRVTLRRILSLFFLLLWGFFLLREIRPDVIHTHSAELGFSLSIPAKVYGIPVVNTCHGISFNDRQFSPVKRMAEKFFLKFSGFKTLITVDPVALQELQNEKIGPAVYIPNGIDREKFRKCGDRKESPVTILFVGRLEKQKGVVYLLEAILQVKTAKKFSLVIVGDGPERKSFERFCYEHNLDGKVSFKGKVDDLSLVRQYQESDIFVLPSLWEGMPLTLLEAAAAELAIIATDAGGVNTVFDNGENALLVEPGNAGALANAITKLIENPAYRHALGKNSSKVTEGFPWEKTVDSVRDVYQKSTGI